MKEFTKHLQKGFNRIPVKIKLAMLALAALYLTPGDSLITNQRITYPAVYASTQSADEIAEVILQDVQAKYGSVAPRASIRPKARPDYLSVAPRQSLRPKQRPHKNTAPETSIKPKPRPDVAEIILKNVQGNLSKQHQRFEQPIQGIIRMLEFEKQAIKK